MTRLRAFPRWAATALAAALVLGACGDGEVAPRRPLTTEAGDRTPLPDQVIESGTHVVTREGVKKAVMVAREISFFNAEGKVEADTMEVTFFDANGVQQSRLSARFGEIDQRTNDMLARGDVRIVAEDGTRIDGEELSYDAARDRIVSTKPVTVFQDGNRIRGQGVEADPALTNIRMTGSSAVLRRAPRAERPRPRPIEGAAAPAPAGGAETPPAAGPPIAPPPAPVGGGVP
ncbi:MAG: LPS export ABC transporter periplasmic protein LptC [Gemmatimonadota bacterium]